MRQHLVIILSLAFFATGCARTAQIRHSAVREAPPAEITESKPVFTVGERFTYIGAWKGIPIGRATATIEELTTYKGREVYRIVVRARTSKILDKLFKVDDTFISYMDTELLTSRHYEARRREGRYKKDVIVEYDFEKMIAIHNNLLDGTVKTCPITENVQDTVSGAYFARTISAKVGDTVKETITLNEKNYEVYVKIAKRVKVDVPNLGTFDAYLVKPYVKVKGKRLTEGRAWGYISADEKRLGLCAVLRVLAIPWVGDISATLVKVEYLDGDRSLPDTILSAERPLPIRK